MRADRILGWPAACSMVWPTSPGAMACSRRVRIAGEGRLELRIPERVAEGHHRLPDRLVHEHATAGDAAVELGGDEAWLGLEVGGIGSPGRQEGVGVLGSDLEGVDEGDRPDLLGQLVAKWYALVHLHALQHHGLPFVRVERAAAASSQVQAILPGEGQPSTGQGRPPPSAATGLQAGFPATVPLADRSGRRMTYMEPGRR